MGIRDTAMSKRLRLPWYEKLTKEQSKDLDTLEEMVKNGEVSASVAFDAWEQHHPGLCACTTFIRHLRNRREAQ